MKSTQELIKLLDLKKINDHNFEGQSATVGSKTVFGGQVLAQALNAAYRCVPQERKLHSLHSYFILPGDLTQPIIFEVNTIRDGGSFSVRRVTAKQKNQDIFILACSFKREGEGLNFQTEMPKVPMPEDLMSMEEAYEMAKDFLPKPVKAFLEVEKPMSFKPTVMPNPLEPKVLPPENYVWFKPKNMIPTDLNTNQQILTYISDYNILVTALRPHADQANFANTRMASLDHSMWFHRAFDFNDWLLYSLKVTNTNRELGLVRGEIFTRDGTLVASVAQEGLMRVKG